MPSLAEATIEDELLLRLCGTSARREAALPRIEELARQADPERLLATFEHQRLTALAGSRLLAAAPDAVPQTFRAAISSSIAANRHRSALYEHVTLDLCRALGAEGIAALPLKGAGLAARAHGDVGLRSAQTDIDVLVAAEDLQRAVAVLARRGYRVEDDVDWGGGLPHYHAQLVAGQPVAHMVELHWRLHWYEREFGERMLERARPAAGGALRPAPVDELAALLLAFARDGYVGLRLAADIAAWHDANSARLPERPLAAALDAHPRLRGPLLAAVDVLDRELGLPAAELIGGTVPRSRRVRLARRLASWSGRGSATEIATNVTLNDLLLTRWGAYRTFVRHYYLQPLDHYLATYGWPQQQRLRNRVRRLAHAAARVPRSAVKYARRLWQLRRGRCWDPLPPPLMPAVTAGEARLLIVSPVRNESAHIARVARAVAAQSSPPDLWLVADDGSDDGTVETVRSLEAEIPFMKLIELPPPDHDGRDRLAAALEAKAFNRALREVDVEAFTHVGKLDGDVELPPEYFERLLAQMEANPTLGLAGGSIVEPTGPGGRWRPITAPRYHVHGALKLFSRECFAAVGGIQERLGWDTIDETYARMRGFQTWRDPELVARHHRPGGSADGKLRGRMRHGECAYVARYSPLWVLARAFKIAAKWDPRPISGLAFAWGYFGAWLRRAERVEDVEFKRFVRGEHRRRALAALGLGGEEAACTTSA